ncbi:hypothetical protein [Roseomonas sp. CECT 9278]|uniref:hypothetical protein n=1 Tax=Roseomonas sp. CECT 9278 TaxID=2845823 RepID=UPI001E2E65F8|nr:hypothetical protein [Roseomonas sp. CECT 9278]
MTEMASPARPRAVVVVSACVMAVSMGLRQCFGLFLEPVVADLGTSPASFGFAVAVHNLVWGLPQLRCGLMEPDRDRRAGGGASVADGWSAAAAGPCRDGRRRHRCSTGLPRTSA